MSGYPVIPLFRTVRIFLADARVEKLTRDLVRHGTACCVGVEAHCARWTAISTLYDDALERAKAARA